MLIPYISCMCQYLFPASKKTGRLAAYLRTAAMAGLFRQTIPYIVTARLLFMKKRRYFMDAMYSRYSSFVMRGW